MKKDLPKNLVGSSCNIKQSLVYKIKSSSSIVKQNQKKYTIKDNKDLKKQDDILLFLSDL